MYKGASPPYHNHSEQVVPISDSNSDTDCRPQTPILSFHLGGYAY